MRRNPVGFLPSLFTVLNLYCGFLSVINASQGEIEQACLFIIYAGLFDTFDGVIARLTHTSSKFGVELDSLADIVSFGVAPSFILYKAYFYQLDGLGIALASLIMIFGALRLARFNTQLVGFDKNYFTGVPVPLAALTISSFFLFYFNQNFDLKTSEIVLIALSILLPLLMLSKFRYDTTPKFSFREFKSHPVKTIIILIVVVMVILTKGEGLFAFCLFYVSTGIFRGFWNFTRKHVFRKHESLTEKELKLKAGD